MDVARGGLDGVEVADTRLSHVDGERGVLVIAGMTVEDLAERGGFEEACALLWDGRWPDPARREEIRQGLAHGRAEGFESLGRLGDALRRVDGMDSLRASVAHLSAGPDARADLPRLAGAMAAFAAAWWRTRQGLAPVAPD